MFKIVKPYTKNFVDKNNYKYTININAEYEIGYLSFFTTRTHIYVNNVFLNKKGKTSTRWSKASFYVTTVLDEAYFIKDF